MLKQKEHLAVILHSYINDFQCSFTNLWGLVGDLIFVQPNTPQFHIYCYLIYVNKHTLFKLYIIKAKFVITHTTVQNLFLLNMWLQTYLLQIVYN